MTSQQKISRVALHVAVATAVVVIISGVSANAQTMERHPVLLDTDIGTDIDDAFAVALALGSYELDVRGITASGSETRNRSMLLCRLLTATGRRHTRVAVGAQPQPERPITDQAKYYYHPDPLFDRTTKPQQEPAVEFLHSRLRQSPGEVTLVALGPLTNVAGLLEQHTDTPDLVRRIVLLESNLGFDIPASRKMLASGIPTTVVSQQACRGLQLRETDVNRVFAPGTALTRQVETLYQMWDRENPPLGEAAAVALCFEDRFIETEVRSLKVSDEGSLFESDDKSTVELVTSIKTDEFASWYVDRMESLVSPADKPVKAIKDDHFPHRVHVAEDFENDIERFWWMSGKPETKITPPGSRRSCRGVLTHDFDDLLMVSRQMYTAVIFNPVPGPPMGPRTRLKFRYWLKGTDRLRVQIYSLTNGYHRQLVLEGLSQEQWQEAVVDMTEARRPDGTGGPLGENERIDDIQFYADADAELVIDDIVLYDAALPDEQRPFPGRIAFTAVFDTGKQGQHWIGDFDLAPDAGNFWRAAKSVTNPETGDPWIRLSLRGQRMVGGNGHLSFRYRLKGADSLRARIRDSATNQESVIALQGLRQGTWTQHDIAWNQGTPTSADELTFQLPKGADLLVDDVILYEPPKNESTN